MYGYKNELREDKVLHRLRDVVGQEELTSPCARHLARMRIHVTTDRFQVRIQSGPNREKMPAGPPKNAEGNQIYQVPTIVKICEFEYPQFHGL